ncbi:hypothetical protein E2562_032420 [Oryza meyeriana var. granulata]|uniref:DUF834 domain-containing protein n=1 Tax=Oryza meyeriana var. granulata TaxID=110450 RepID=A0A6G1CVR0_9ORYZ|nr:hypothetical protein E2562_032420 [Oryza meyeriana var. granulata]
MDRATGLTRAPGAVMEKGHQELAVAPDPDSGGEDPGSIGGEGATAKTGRGRRRALGRGRHPAAAQDGGAGGPPPGGDGDGGGRDGVDLAATTGILRAVAGTEVGEAGGRPRRRNTVV